MDGGPGVHMACAGKALALRGWAGLREEKGLGRGVLP